MVAATVRPPGPRQSWRVRIPGGLPLATPAVVAGRVFVGGGYGSHEFHAFDAESGRQIWRIRTDDDGPTAAVVVDDLVAFNTESCTIYVVEAASGREVWKKWLGDPLMAQPAADRLRVYMAYPGRDGRHRLAAFALRSGEPLWEAPLGHDIITAPVLHGRSVYVSTYDGKVHRFDAATGMPDWSKDYRATSAPWVEGDEVMVSRREEGADAPEESLRAYRSDSGESSRAYAYAHKKAAYLSSKRHSPESARLDELDASVGFSAAPAAAKLSESEALLGEYRVSGTSRYQGSRPVVSGGRCSVLVGDELESVEVGTGRKVWTRKPRAKPGRGGRHFQSPAAAGGKLFVATAAGSLDCLRGDDGENLWSFEVGAPLEWSPSVAAGRVYLGTMDGQLVAVETGDPADDGWPMWGGGPGHNGPEAGA